MLLQTPMFRNLRSPRRRAGRLALTAILAVAASSATAVGDDCSPCPPDLDDDCDVDFDDVFVFLSNWNCSDCPEDFNGDGFAEYVDLVYLFENFGDCPSAVPGDMERFDEIVVVDATDAGARERGLLVTHVYATGSDVEAGTALFLSRNARIDAYEGTTFYQDPNGGDYAPSSADVQDHPALAYDTFVTTNRLVDDEETVSGYDDLALSETQVDGSWLIPSDHENRDAVDISEATGDEGRYGVLIAQITLDVQPGAGLAGYAGPVRLYTSTHDGGTLWGEPVVVNFGASICPPDLDDDGLVGPNDRLELLASWGPCEGGCPADFNDDGFVDVIDLVYLEENVGECPSTRVGEREVFDELVAVDVTDNGARALGLIVTHVYATGDDVDLEDPLLIVADTDIVATGDSLFFQEPVYGGDTPPDGDDIQVEPALAYDTFVTNRKVRDDAATTLGPGFAMSDTTIDGSWFVPGWTSEQRRAVSLGGDRYGVLIAQITLDSRGGRDATYSGTLRLYTSTYEDGALQGVDATVAFEADRCPADLDASGDVGFPDLLAVLAAFDQQGGPEDLDGSGVVDFGDLLVVLSSWGPCP